MLSASSGTGTRTASSTFDHDRHPWRTPLDMDAPPKGTKGLHMNVLVLPELSPTNAALWLLDSGFRFNSWYAAGLCFHFSSLTEWIFIQRSSMLRERDRKRGGRSCSLLALRTRGKRRFSVRCVLNKSDFETSKTCRLTFKILADDLRTDASYTHIALRQFFYCYIAVLQEEAAVHCGRSRTPEA